MGDYKNTILKVSGLRQKEWKKKVLKLLISIFVSFTLEHRTRDVFIINIFQAKFFIRLLKIKGLLRSVNKILIF